ncbi:uncharacterized protein LOC135498833 isoform X2 [Lineus longissimus]
MAAKDKIAIVICSDDLTGSWISQEDEALRNALAERNLDFTQVAWDDQDACWEDYSAILIRYTFDYVKKAEEFRTWVEERKSIGKPRMWNSPDVILWNAHKRYLEYFRENGVNVPEIVYCEKGSAAPELIEVLSRRGWDKAVVKPAVSCGSYRLFAIETTDARAKQAEFEKYLQEGDMMIQRYVPEIKSNGEYSLMYFDKMFSHAVIKFPADGDFRTSPCLGVIGIEPIDPPKHVLKMADRVVSLVKEDSLLYARVDVIELENGEVTLIELEVIEPVLHLARKEGAADTFVAALVRNMEASSLN